MDGQRRYILIKCIISIFHPSPNESFAGHLEGDVRGWGGGEP